MRLNDRKLGQNSLDAGLMGMLAHVNTFNDLSEVPLAETWGKRYALGERDEVFRYGNPYRCESGRVAQGVAPRAPTDPDLPD